MTIEEALREADSHHKSQSRACKAMRALSAELRRYRAGVEVEGTICFDDGYQHWCFYPRDSNALKIDEDHKRVRILVMAGPQEVQG